MFFSRIHYDSQYTLPKRLFWHRVVDPEIVRQFEVFLANLSYLIKLFPQRFFGSFVGIVQHEGIINLLFIDSEWFEDSMKIQENSQSSNDHNTRYDPHQEIIINSIPRRALLNNLHIACFILLMMFQVSIFDDVYCFKLKKGISIQMESEDNLKVIRAVEEKNSEIRKHNKISSLASTFKVKFDTSFGINSTPISNQLQMVGEKYVTFMVGSIVVVKDLTDKSEYFYSYPNHFNNVTAIYAVSKQQKFKEKGKQLDKDGNPIYLPNTVPVKLYLGESSDNQDQLASIVSVKPYKNRIRTMCTGMKGTIKELSVDRVKKTIICLLISPQSTYVVIFNYRKQKLINSTMIKNASIESISFHPQKPKSLLFMGKNYLRLWELHPQENVLKENQQLVPLKVEKQSRFYDFSWQNNSKNPILIVLTSKNKILIIQNDTLVHTIQLNQKQQLYSVVSTKKGFCVGGSNKCLSIYEMDKSFSHNLILGSPSKVSLDHLNEEKIVKIHNSINDTFFTVICTNEIGSFNFFYINTSRIDADISSLEPFFASGFHNKKINSLSCSVTKQILGSCSEDNTVKLWNFFEIEGYEKKGLVSQTFTQEPISIAMHPSGLFVAVSFSSGFKIFAIVNDRLEVLKDIQIPNCKIIKYSHGGHFLTVNEKQHIFIYDSIYYQTLNLFSLSNYVQDITISHDDTKIIATCVNGYVYCFSLYDSIHNKDYHNKKGYEHKQSKAYSCIAYDNKITLTDKNDKQIEVDLFAGATTEKYLVLYKNRCKDLIAEFPITDCHITSLLVCPLQGALLAGTSKGTLRVYAWPMIQESLELELSGSNKIRIKQPQFLQIIAHSYPIVSICASHDEGYVFTGSEDGTILCFSFVSLNDKDKKEGYSLIKPEDRKRIAQSANDLYLERVDKIEEKNEAIKKLKFEILRSEKKLKLQKQKLDIIYRQKIQTLKKEYKLTLETNKRIKDSYIQNSLKEHQQLTDKLENQKNRYKEEIQKLKKDHQDKIDFQVKRNNSIRNEIEALHTKHAEQIEQLKKEHEKTMKQTKFDFYQKCHQLQIKYSNFLNQSKKHSEQFASQLNKKEKEYQREIEMEIRSKKEQIVKVKGINKELEARNEKLTEEYNKLKRQDEEQQEIFEKLFKQHNDIRFQNLKSDEEILKMQHQLLERLQVIESKEETCKNARYQQTTLENFRYMLDSKIQSLEEKKAQMIEKIRNRESDLKNMFNQLIKESQENQKKALELKQLNVKIQGLQKEIKIAEEEIDINQNKLKYFKAQVASIANSDDDAKTIGKRLKKLIEESQKTGQEFYVQREGGEQQDTTKEVNEQLQRQARWMQKKLKMVKDIAINYKEMREENINGVLAQNTKLIEECTKLRQMNDEYKKSIKNHEKELSDLIRKKDKSVQIKKMNDSINFKGINKKLEQHEMKISDQKNELASMNEQIKDIIKSRSEAKFKARKLK